MPSQSCLIKLTKRKVSDGYAVVSDASRGFYRVFLDCHYGGEIMGKSFRVDFHSGLKTLSRFTFFLMISAFPFSIEAADVDLEKDLQKNIEGSRSIVSKISDKLELGGDTSREINQLKTVSEEIRASHLLMQERFKQREEKVKTLGAKATERQRTVAEGYRKALEEYLNLVDTISPGRKVSKATIDQLRTLLDSFVHKSKRPIIGSLPYKHLNYPITEPSTAPSITPAYQGGNPNSTNDDLKSTSEAPISTEIADLAQSLGWSPMQIYEYVKNNVETEWYWGCMKGAEETLRQKSGNDCDQATLLAALLRASNFPARYVRGTIEFFPDIERVKNLTGIDDPQRIVELFQKAGIPFKTVLDGAVIRNIQIEHLWVETLVPYANYRGAIVDDRGKIWLGLDTSIKASGYTYNTVFDIVSEYSLTSIRDDYLNAAQSQTPLEYLQTQINDYLLVSHPSTTYSDYLRTKTLVPEVMQILPASMQFTQVKVTHEYTEMPDELKHKVTFTANDMANNELFAMTLDTLSLSNRTIALSFEPETVEDQEIIDSYGGLDNTPSYLIRLRPVLKVNGERIGVGKDGLQMGSDYTLSVKLIAPQGTEEVTDTLVIGNLSVIALSAEKIVTPAVLPDDKRNAESILYEEAIHYIDRWNNAENELSSLMRLALARPIPTMVMAGGVAEVTYLLDTPHGYTLKGVYVDADLRRIEAVATDNTRITTFMQLSSLQGSILENKIFEDDFQVQAMSTAKFLTLANSNAVTVLTIDATNIDTILPTLTFDQNIKDDITTSISQGLVVRMPQSEISYENWTGIGYIKENPETGESGWMLSGSIAGGMTAWSFDRWPTYYADRLTNPYSEPSIYDPASTYFIDKITETDMQMGTVAGTLGDPLSLPETLPLQVFVHKNTMSPVPNVPVTFTIKAGGGLFSNLSTNITVSTNGAGIASVKLILGQRTSNNPTEMRPAGAEYNEQVGENIIDASLASGTKIAVPFTAYGLPGPAVALNKLHGDGVTSMILSSSGFIAVSVEDQYGNPISNRPVNFDSAQASSSDGCGNPQDWALLAKMDNPCVANGPTVGSCSDISTHMTVTTNIEGAAVQVLLGNMPAATYPISVVSGALPIQTFIHSSEPFGNCGGGLNDPSLTLAILPVEWKDVNGNNVFAAKSGDILPISAKVYFLKEGEEIRNETLSCGDGPHTCPKVVGSRTYSTVTNFDSATVTFNGQSGANDGSGKFTNIYVLQPGLNTINIDATASTTVHRTFNTCEACMSTEHTESPTGTISRTVQVYGVDISTPIIPTIVVDNWGYSVSDTEITYAILPQEYVALSASIYLYKNGVLIATIPTEKQGNGNATISRGFQFDVNSMYETEVVLNYGTTFEMRSKIVRIQMLSVELRANGVVLNSNNPYVYIDATPAMPQLTAKLKPDGLAGNVNWKLKIEYGRDNRNDVDLFPANGSTTLPANTIWSITPELATTLRGGKATITWELVGVTTPQSYVFHVRGRNPSESEAASEIGADPWYGKAIARNESDQPHQHRYYSQLNEIGELGPEWMHSKYCPNWGPPHGWGMMQLELPYSASASALWDWKTNVSVGLYVMSIARSDAQSYFEAIKRTFPDEWEEPPTATPFGASTTLSALDAASIQLYNGAAVVRGDLLQPDGVHTSVYRSSWEFSETAPAGSRWTFVENENDYVEKIVREYELNH
jgi:hypothetical protein